jgi:hypothetical protein
MKKKSKRQQMPNFLMMMRISKHPMKLNSCHVWCYDDLFKFYTAVH